MRKDCVFIVFYTLKSDTVNCRLEDRREKFPKNINVPVEELAKRNIKSADETSPRM